MSCERFGAVPASFDNQVPATQARTAALQEFAAWDIENLWQNCRAAGFTDDEIRAGIIDLAERTYRRHQEE